MNKLKIQDLSFCQTVSGRQVRGEYGSQRWLTVYIRNYLDPAFSYEEDGLEIKGYQNQDDYAVISSSPDGRKQIIGLVGQDARGRNYAISSSRITSL